MRSALSAIAALYVAREVALRGQPWLFERGWVAAACGALALAHLACLAPPLREGARLAVSCARLTVLTLCTALWGGDARELWAAAALFVAWSEGDEGNASRAPLVPALVAGAVLLALGARHPAPRIERALVLLVVAAALTQRAAERRRPEGTGP